MQCTPSRGAALAFVALMFVAERASATEWHRIRVSQTLFRDWKLQNATAFGHPQEETRIFKLITQKPRPECPNVFYPASSSCAQSFATAHIFTDDSNSWFITGYGTWIEGYPAIGDSIGVMKRNITTGSITIPTLPANPKLPNDPSDQPRNPVLKYRSLGRPFVNNLGAGVGVAKSRQRLR